MSRFEEYLEAVKSVVINEGRTLEDLISIIKNRDYKEKKSGDGAYHYFNDIEKGAVVAYDPKIFQNVGRGFVNKYKSYLDFHGQSDVKLVPATKEDGVPVGFIGWKWGQFE